MPEIVKNKDNESELKSKSKKTTKTKKPIKTKKSSKTEHPSKTETSPNVKGSVENNQEQVNSNEELQNEIIINKLTKKKKLIVGLISNVSIVEISPKIEKPPKTKKSPKPKQSVESNQKPVNSNEKLQNEIPTNKWTNKKKWIVGLIAGTSIAGVLATTIAVPIITMQQINQMPIEIKFINSNFVYLKQKIVIRIEQDNLSVDGFDVIVLDFFKENLKASNENISNLIQNVEITSHSESSTTFKVTLSLDKDKYQYSYDGSDSNIKIVENILWITYEGPNNIEFKKE